MRLGIMQPYFFPYIGYYKLIAKTDYWCVFNVAQYTKKTWMNRNRILHPTKGWQYITIPVRKHQRSAKIMEIEIKEPDLSLKKILGQLDHYKKYAPYYKEAIEIVNITFKQCKSVLLSELNLNSLKTVCSYLGINFNYCICSDLNSDLFNITHPGQWAIEISLALGAKEYLNPEGGKEIFNQTEFKKSGIKLMLQDMISFEYDCKKYDFEPNLSVLDIVMWNSPKKIRQFLLS